MDLEKWYAASAQLNPAQIRMLLRQCMINRYQSINFGCKLSKPNELKLVADYDGLDQINS